MTDDGTLLHHTDDIYEAAWLLYKVSPEDFREFTIRYIKGKKPRINGTFVFYLTKDVDHFSRLYLESPMECLIPIPHIKQVLRDFKTKLQHAINNHASLS